MWYSAIMMGLAGSLHCLGMCSPLAMAATGSKGFAINANRLLYNGGRILTYGIQGIVVSSVGVLLEFSGFQKVISISIGIMFVAFGLTGMIALKVPFLTSWMNRLTLFFKSAFGHFLSRKSLLSMTILGMLNGLLPCGLTYLALAYCITLPNVADGFLFMVVFGLGTLPVMLGLTSVFQWTLRQFRIDVRRVTVFVLIIIGGLLISRSLMHNHTPTDDHITVCR